MLIQKGIPMPHKNMRQYLTPVASSEEKQAHASAGLQFCPLCQNSKLLMEFHASTRGKSGGYCIECKRKKNRQHYLAHPGDRTDTHRQRTYGVSPEDYEAMMLEQERSCGICKRPFEGMASRSIHIDHDHQTGAVRGILCQNCNNGAALLLDNPDLILEACCYIARAKNKHEACIAQFQDMSDVQHGGVT
jgi:5-methylcytosine-specific restriction endonuclease McrA